MLKNKKLVFLLVGVVFGFAMLAFILVSVFINNQSQDISVQEVSYPVSTANLQFNPVSFFKTSIGSFYIDENGNLNKTPDESMKPYSYKVASLSSGKDLIAYIEKAGDKEFLKVSSLNNPEAIYSTEILNNRNKYVSSWSPDDNFLILSESSGSIFNQQHEVFKLAETLQRFNVLETYDNKFIWEKENVYFFKEKINCDVILQEVCDVRELWLVSYNVLNSQTEYHTKVQDLKGYPPVIESIRIENSEIIIKYSILKPISYSDVSSLNYYSFVYKLQ